MLYLLGQADFSFSFRNCRCPQSSLRQLLQAWQNCSRGKNGCAGSVLILLHALAGQPAGGIKNFREDRRTASAGKNSCAGSVLFSPPFKCVPGHKSCKARAAVWEYNPKARPGPPVPNHPSKDLSAALDGSLCRFQNRHPAPGRTRSSPPPHATASRPRGIFFLC